MASEMDNSLSSPDSEELPTGYSFQGSTGLFYQPPSNKEAQAEEIGFLSLTKSNGSSGSGQYGVTLTWRDLSVYVNQKADKKTNGPPFKRVLNNVRGALQPGSLVALMGASGAGKSTLLNALACRCPPGVIVDGDIRVNGRPMGRYFCDMSGYVYQDDIFISSLTPKEHLQFTARLKMNGGCTKQEREDRVKKLINELGLTKCQNTIIGAPGIHKSLSGGERKRISFAAQVLTDPPVLFCDEPTTGLDAFSAERLVVMLKDLTQQGKTIVCTIHQPSSEVFALFDRLVLLAEGRIAYQGSSTGALSFFESVGYQCPATYNPADFYVQTLAIIPGLEDTSRTTIRAICDRFAVTSTAKQIDLLIQFETSLGQDMVDLSSKSGSHTVNFRGNFQHSRYLFTVTVIDNFLRKHAVWPIEFFWLLWRAFVDSYRNPAVHSLRIIQKIAIATLAGLCYHGLLNNGDQRGIQNIQGALFILTTENTFPALYGTLGVFPMEWPVFIRESRSKLYSPSAYYFSKVLALLPGFVIETVVFITISYWLMGLRPDMSSFLYTCFILIVTCNTAAACGTFFSAAFESIPMAISVLIPFDYILFITGGVLISLNSLPDYLWWTKYLSWFLYTNEALSSVQWEGIQSIRCESNGTLECLTTGDKVLEHYSFQASRFTVDIVSMFITYGIFHALGLIAIIKRSKS